MQNIRYLSNSHSYDQIVAVPVPKFTRSYTPISNKDLVDNLKIVIEHYGMKVERQYYQLGRAKKQLFGAFTIASKDSEMRQAIGFRNSYDKSLPVGFVAGAEVVVCSNLMFEGEIKRVRKHSGNVLYELQDIMEESVQHIKKSFKKIRKEKKKLERVIVDPTLTAEILGDLFLQEDIINVRQVSIFKQEYDKVAKAEGGSPVQSGWQIMNHLTQTLKKTPPDKRMEHQTYINNYLNQKLKLV